MNSQTRDKITKGLKTTEFWVVLVMGVLTSLMVMLQEHSQNVLPVELQMRILGGLATAYVICRTVLKLGGLLATVLKLDRGGSMPVPAPPAGVKLPEMPVPTLPGLGMAPQENPVDVTWTQLREEELRREDVKARQEELKAVLRAAGVQPPDAPTTPPPPVVISSRATEY